MSCECPPPIHRRRFLSGAGAGLGGIAWAHLLGSGSLNAAATENGSFAARRTHFPAKAKRVVWLSMHGGPSHVDLFDPKPELIRWAGKPLPESMGAFETRRKVAANPLVAPVKPFAKRGQSGLEVSDFLPHLAGVADELCVIRSCHGDSVNHPQSVSQMNTGSILMGKPSMGAWVSYGLGSENEDMPALVSCGRKFWLVRANLGVPSRPPAAWRAVRRFARELWRGRRVLGASRLSPCSRTIWPSDSETSSQNVCLSRARCRRKASASIRATPKAQRQNARLSMSGSNFRQSTAAASCMTSRSSSWENCEDHTDTCKVSSCSMKSRGKWSCCSRSESVIQAGCSPKLPHFPQMVSKMTARPLFRLMVSQASATGPWRRTMARLAESFRAEARTTFYDMRAGDDLDHGGGERFPQVGEPPFHAARWRLMRDDLPLRNAESGAAVR